MNQPKQIQDLTIVEINAEIGVRMEGIEQANAELAALRQRRQFLRNVELVKNQEEPK